MLKAVKQLNYTIILCDSTEERIKIHLEPPEDE